MNKVIRHCAAGGHPEVIIATGGDDQALSALKVALESKERLLGTVKGSVMLASAHSSAIKVTAYTYTAEASACCA